MTAAAGAAGRDRRWTQAALLAGLAGLLMLPVIAGPVRLNDSHWINLVWSEQFTHAVAGGTPWPRWLPRSHGGLGAPVFFFYGPVAFWLAAGFGLAGLGTWPALVAAAMLALWGSGVAMAHFLRGRASRPLLGAALYMALPYHLLDFKLRGALAESVAYAALPLVASGVRAAGRGRVAGLALGYALLITTHLPIALLASLSLIPFVMVDEHGRDRRALLRCAGGLLLGAGLAAPYWLPALLLQPHASLATMTGTDALRAARWTVWSHDPRIIGGLKVIGGMGATLLPLALARARRDRWAWLALALVAAALGLVPTLWTVPPLAQVQFPWRLLAIAEFATAVVAARAGWPAERLALALAPPLIAALMVLHATPPRSSPLPAAALAAHADVIEYLPPELGEPQGVFSQRALRLAAVTPPVRVVDGTTVLRRFAFPSWQVRCGARDVATAAQPGTGLLGYRGIGCTLRRRVTGPEWIGWLLAATAGGTLAWSAAMRQPALRPRAGRPRGSSRSVGSASPAPAAA